MPRADLRGAAAAIGIGQAGIPSGHGRTHLELLAEAARAALADAGHGLRDVDGLFTTNLVNATPALTIAEHLGIRPQWIDSTQVGGSSFVHYAISAAAALKLGLCKVALIVYGSDAGSNRTPPLSRHEFVSHEAEYAPPFPITGAALAAMRHMKLFGTTRAQLASVAIAARQWAIANPELPAQRPLSLPELLDAPMVVDPFTRFDCGQPTDGAGAIVMVASERSRDARRPPVYFLGGGTELSHRRIAEIPDLTTTAAIGSGARAFAMAGLGAKDVDVVQLYDGFTIYPIMFLEDLGFCAKGEGGPFVEAGHTLFGGDLPANTNGGSLSGVHPGMYGVFQMIEAIVQLRGAAGKRQVKDAEAALCHGNGGHLSSQSTVIWGSATTL
jgi:acetyl-CoA acetyltransferase